MKRHLYFFACASEKRNTKAWKFNIAQILNYWNVFNGRKLIMIATGEGLRPVAEVKGCFAGRDAEFLEVPNDPEKRETFSFIKGLSKFETKVPAEAVFYAHSKGVSYAPCTVLDSILRWCQAMYILNLGSIKLVDWALQRYATMGAFRQRMDLARSSWHYSGTFFWMRCADLFARDWQTLHRGHFGVEGYPGRIFKESESFDPSEPTPPAVLYNRAPSPDTAKGWLDKAVLKCR